MRLAIKASSLVLHKQTTRPAMPAPAAAPGGAAGEEQEGQYRPDQGMVESEAAEDGQRAPLSTKASITIFTTSISGRGAMLV